MAEPSAMRHSIMLTAIALVLSSSMVIVYDSSTSLERHLQKTKDFPVVVACANDFDAADQVIIGAEPAIYFEMPKPFTKVAVIHTPSVLPGHQRAPLERSHGPPRIA